MVSAWASTLSSRHAEVLDAFHLHNEDSGRNEITCSQQRGVLGRYLRWLETAVFDADPLDTEDGRDQAVTRYVRVLVINSVPVRMINAELALLRRFYAWRGTGAHNVPAVSADHPDLARRAAPTASESSSGSPASTPS